MNLEKLVPPLELCKQIPAGEFADSALVWIEVEIPQKSKKEWRIANRTKPIEYCNNPKFPAPMLEEVMAAMPYCRVYKKITGMFIAVHEKTRVCHMDGATAALKLWLRLKGVEE